jgi:hypothetical protein
MGEAVIVRASFSDDRVRRCENRFPVAPRSLLR